MRTNSEPVTSPPPLDADLCWRAWVRRDRRFEGRFFMGVTSTGIYCRPGCPARLPARRNVLFFRSAAAAESGGFRACQRCRPDSLPGSAAAAGTSAIVARALRLIESGALDQDSLERLAERLGVTSRWLRELFVRQIGAAPLAVAQTRRAHLARRLVESSAMPLEDVAAASGFGSARRLRHALQRTFGRSARTLRARRAGARPAALALELRARGAFDPAPAFAFLSPRAIPGVEQVQGLSWRRTFALPDGAAIVEVSADRARQGLALRIPPVPHALPGIVARVSRVFDLDADAAGIAAELRADPFLRARMPVGGVRLTGAWDAFEMGVRAIVGQQISVAAARTLLGRIVERCGAPLPATDGPLARLFPTPAALAACDLAGVGLTPVRANTLHTFASAVAEGRLDLEALSGLEATIAALTALPGIGEWTAHEIALRALGETDAFPHADLGLRRALASRGRLPSAARVRSRAERWRPWRGYAAVALWHADSKSEGTSRARSKRTARPHRKKEKKT